MNGVSTRKVKRVTEELCGREFSKSTVSRLVKGLNKQGEVWNEQSLEGTTYSFVLVDAMVIKVRRQEAVRSTSALLAVGVNAEGYREILGIRIANSETERGWMETFRWMKSRGLPGVDVVISDAHEALVEALRRWFQGASWQRCQTHFRRNILDSVKGHRVLLSLGTSIFSHPGSRERLIQELRRREKVIRIFPNDESAWQLLGSYAAEPHEDWSTGRRYFRMDAYFEWRERQAAQQPLTPAA